MEIPLSQEDFLSKYNINDKEFQLTKLQWKDLNQIYSDYIQESPTLESSAIYVFNSLMKVQNVHSVRYRIKDPEHVIEKIIRKRINEPEREITVENYKTELTDLIGIRALHLFKEQWNVIHKFITATWNLKELPVANFREGDPAAYRKKFEELGCQVKEHPHGYRSVHYIVETRPSKRTFYAEIQVRTIFEEAWSEIDHTIRYPYDQNNPIFGQYLSILNRLAGSADEMGTYISFLREVLQHKEIAHRLALAEKDKLIQQLENKVNELNLGQQDSSFLTEGLQKLKIPSLDYSDFKTLDINTIKSLAEYALPTYGLGLASGILPQTKHSSTPAQGPLNSVLMNEFKPIQELDKVDGSNTVESSQKKLL